MGRFCKDIDLVRRGLITQITVNGQERPLSEYEIRAVRLQDRNPEEIVPPIKKSSIAVSLPPQAKPITVSDIEQEPLWAQSRVPYFRKRDDGPFRRKEDPSYMDSFVLIDQECSAPRQAWLRGSIEKGGDVQCTTEIVQGVLNADHTPESKEAKLEAHNSQRNNEVYKMGNGSWKFAGTGETRQSVGGSQDIGTVYRGRRHSISLD
ncbi:hypothetical protein SLS60_004968 [Paraconiothyrium brasiliense]|uniref:Uncharacterized protein n=1 Tax=Paraconiothyrium brasiliense TaxID=300254 RepID=A0ABR3RMB5_9PLEO